MKTMTNTVIMNNDYHDTDDNNYDKHDVVTIDTTTTSTSVSTTY